MSYEKCPCSGELDTNLDVLAMLNSMARDTAEKLGEVTFRYKMMCDECAKLEKSLEDYRERAGYITSDDFGLDISCKDIWDWMKKHQITDVKTGRKTTIANRCLEDSLKAKEEKLKANADAAAKLQEEIGQQRENAEKLVKD